MSASETPGPDKAAEQPSVSDAFEAAVKKSSLGKVSADEAPTGTAILTAIGGVRGLVESILPSFAFLIVFLATEGRMEDRDQLLWSTLVPLAISVVFVVIRIVQRAPVTPAVTGAVGVGITAFLAIASNNANNNFIPGILINAALLVAMLVSLVIRKPLIGFIVGVLLGERAEGWQQKRRARRVLTSATWLWVALFAIRLIVEVPLYLADETAALGTAKLILGVPFYALVLWITWIIVRSLYPPEPKPAPSE
jgi:hypothetical protein